jgi:hypothetical protein
LTAKDFKKAKESFLNPSLFQLKNSYSISQFTDQPSACILLKKGPLKKWIVIDGYGGRRPDTNLLPPLLLNMLNRLEHFESVDAKPWFPKKVEVFLRPHGNTGLRPIPWDKSWPDLHSPAKRKIEDGYKLPFTPSQWRALESLLIPPENRDWTMLDGKSWKVSYHIPLP